MRAGWRQRINHHNGFLMVTLLIFLALTGVGVFYLVNDAAVLMSALGHTFVGLFLLPLVFIYHFIAGQRILQRRSQRLTRVDKGSRNHLDN